MGIEAASGCGIERFTVPRMGMKPKMCGHVARAVWLACSRIRGSEDNASVSGSIVGSDAVLDAFLAEEPEARVACETFATTNRVVIGGEVGLSDQTKLTEYMGRIEEIARACIEDIGYDDVYARD